MSPKADLGVVLMVEDPFVCSFVGHVLAAAGWRFHQKDMDEALAILRARELPVALVITNKPEPFIPFAEQVPLLYMAAFPDATLAARFRNCGMLSKPFRPAELTTLVAQLAPTARGSSPL
jgi:hypothetical protein